jgi:hypothetical protein
MLYWCGRLPAYQSAGHCTQVAVHTVGDNSHPSHNMAREFYREGKVAKFAFLQTKIFETIPDCVEVGIALKISPIHS